MLVSLTGRKNTSFQNQIQTNMCEFHYDFDSDEAFYYCCDRTCRYVDEREDGFISVSITLWPSKQAISNIVTFKLNPDVRVATLMSWMDVTGDIPCPRLFYRGQALSLDRTLASYEIANGESLKLSSLWPHEVHITLARRIVLDARPETWLNGRRMADWGDLQADSVMPGLDDFRGLFDNFKQKLLQFDPTDVKQIGQYVWLVDLYEKTMTMCYWMSRPNVDLRHIIHLSYQVFTGKTITKGLLSYWLPKEILQGGFEETVGELRSFFTLTTSSLSSPVVKKFQELYTYLLVQGFLSRFGLDISDREYRLLSSKSSQVYKEPVSLICCAIDTTLFICERLIDYRKTGDMTVFIHTDAAYKAWSDKADKVLELGPFTSNLGAHGTTYFSFISDLNDAIEKGDAIRKHSLNRVGIESTLLSRKLQNLKMLKNVEVTRRASQKEREAPFGVLVHGASSVGKSTFTKMLYYYYGSLHGLEKEDHFRYVRNPADEYWSNFDSSKWCIQLDDIAFLLPNKSSDIDPTLKEMLNVVNNVPYVPPQAALEDKGKTPVLAKLVVATTNAKDLNAHEYFYCPLAVRRRLPYVVHVTPKTEYLHENKKFLNTDALPSFDGKYPNFWTITVQKIVPIESNGRDRAKLVDVEKFDDVEKFLEHYGKASFAHLKTQEASNECDAGMRKINVCPLCFMSAASCNCLQADTFTYTSMCRNFVYELTCACFMKCLAFSWYMWFIKQIAKFRLGKKLLAKIANAMDLQIQMKLFSVVNFIAQPQNYPTALFLLHFLAGYVGTHIALYTIKTVSSVFQKTKQPAVSESGSLECEIPDLDLQGNIMNTTENDLPKEEQQNVWYTPTLELNAFDVPPASLSNAVLTPEQIRDLFAQNCVRIEAQIVGGRKFRTGGVFVRGQILIMNSHVFREGSEYDIVISNMSKQGLSSNHSLRLKKTDMFFDYGRDMVCVQIMSMPPCKDILKYWNENLIPVSMMLSVRRDNAGSVTFQHIYNVGYVANFPVEVLEICLPIYMGKGERESANGDCGALGVAVTPRGPVIMGLHTLGRSYTYGFTHISRQDVLNLVEQATVVKHVEGGGMPKLGLSKDVTLTAPHFKSLFRYIPEGTARIYGSFPGFRSKPRSRVTRTPIAGSVLQYFKTEIKHGAPSMNGWKPWRKNVVEMVKPKVEYNRDILLQARNSYISGILDTLDQSWQAELVVLSRRATVNGLPGVKFIDRINCNTSMGHPWNTSKKKFLVPDIDEKYPDGVDFTEEIWDEAVNIESSYKQGKRAFAVYTGHLKDEALPIKKCEDGATRMFTGSSVPFSLVVRKYLLSFVRLVQKNKYAFEAAPGMVVQSMEWSTAYDYLTEFGQDRMIAGDYSKFDKRMISDFILMAYDIIIELHARAGFSEEELVVMRGIACDTAFPLVNVDGDLVEFYGTNPSGHPLTVIINSLVNSLYMRYAYICLSQSIGKEVDDFKVNVRLLTYGDDNIMGVSQDAPWFNHTSIQAVLDTIGVGYTMADKGANSVPYISISECSFLKRKWRFDEEVGAWLAPLEEESIHKSLTMWVPSSTIDKYAQTIDVVRAANMEYFFYGREIFEKHHKFFKELLLCEPYCHYVTETTLPGWDEFRDRFWEASRHMAPALDNGLGRSFDSNQQSQKNNNAAQKVREQRGANCDNASMSLSMEDLDINPDEFILQSEEVDTPVPLVDGGSGVDTEENVTFIDNEVGQIVKLPTSGNPVAMVDSTEDLSLGRFLSRPTLIDTFSWSTSDVIGVQKTIKPWFLMLNNTAIKKKIDNYAFFRGVLHIKVLVNGTPFQYGCLRAAYSPLRGFVSDKIRVNPISNLPLAIPYSQQPGFFIYPQANAGGEMECRFFLHKNWLDLTSASEIQNMGTINYFIYAPLGVAVTGGSTSVTVRTYAWMTDVELMGSTSKLSLQGDEYGNGPVSRPASYVASLANKLTNIPVIGRFARATEIGASAVSQMASLFGYTNVPVIADVMPFYPMNAPMLATAQIGVPFQKLTLDPKQELSIDPSPHGIGSHDELAIRSIISRESFYSSTNWSTSDVAGTQIWNSRVGPSLWGQVDINNVSAVTVGKRVYHTPLSYIGAMFKHWRGDIIIRIKVVCTKFHKGRLKISYDPINNISTTDPDENVVYTEILDIGEKDDIEIVVPYHQALGWLSHDQTIQDNWTPGNSLAPRSGIDNGLITVRVLNTLTAPASGTINLLFFVRAGDNFEFANPAGHIGPDFTASPSFFNLQAEDITDVVSTRVIMGKPSYTIPERYALNYGEVFASLRNILHRSMIIETVVADNDTAAICRILKKFFRRMPCTPGYDPSYSATSANNVIAASGTSAYCFNRMSHISYVAGMFLGYRGGVNYIVTPSSDVYGNIGDMRVYRATSGETSSLNRWLQTLVGYDTITSRSNRSRNLNGSSMISDDGLGGAAITSTITNGSLMFNIPDYNNYNFSLVDPVIYVHGSTADGTRDQLAVLNVLTKTNSVTSYLNSITFQTAMSAGPDFTCLHFLCCPTLDIANSVPGAP